MWASCSASLPVCIINHETEYVLRISPNWRNGPEFRCLWPTHFRNWIFKQTWKFKHYSCSRVVVDESVLVSRVFVLERYCTFNSYLQSIINKISTHETNTRELWTRFDYEYDYDYDYEIRHFGRKLLASFRADVMKS